MTTQTISSNTKVCQSKMLSTSALIQTENQNRTIDNTKTLPKSSSAQRMRTNLRQSVGAITTT